MKNLFSLLALLLIFSCNSSAQKKTENNSEKFKISKTEQEWKSLLTERQFYVLIKSGTERPFSSPLNKIYDKGTYFCAACNTPLFKSEHKFDSKSGWPSFDREIKGNVSFSIEKSFGSIRTEEHCGTCGGHLGHVFNDGPNDTTGKRHCINGVALKFSPD